MAIIMVFIFLPTILFGIKLSEIISSFLFSIGCFYFGCFQNGRFNIKKLDIKDKKYYNWQGYSLFQYLSTGLIFVIGIGIIFIINQLFGEEITLWVISIIGIIFILTNKLWLMSISRNFMKNRHYRLECFREK
jgi:hypothetical protein